MARFHDLSVGAFSLSADGARCDVTRKKGKLIARPLAASVVSTSAEPFVVFGGPMRATTDCPARPEGPGGLENCSASLEAPVKPANVLAVCTLKFTDEVEGVVVVQDHKPQRIRDPVDIAPSRRNHERSIHRYK